MRLSDAGLRRHPTKLIYPNHPLPPWLTEDTTPRSLEPMVRSLAIWAPLRLAGYPVMISVHLYIWAMRKKVLCFSARFHLRTVCAPSQRNGAVGSSASTSDLGPDECGDANECPRSWE